jgi:hypothetical protein
MKQFIHNENLKLWRRQVAETTDPQKRAVLLHLIDKEEGGGINMDNGTAAKTADRDGRSA